MTLVLVLLAAVLLLGGLGRLLRGRRRTRPPAFQRSVRRQGGRTGEIRIRPGARVG